MKTYGLVSTTLKLVRDYYEANHILVRDDFIIRRIYHYIATTGYLDAEALADCVIYFG